MPAHVYILTALAAYFLGSVPTGFLVARAKGVDIRGVGSGNIGATNAFRVLGKGLGLLVLLLDFAKGLLACLGVPPLMATMTDVELGGHAIVLGLVAAVGSVLGHNFTVWLRFKGGKGVATSAGALAALTPLALAIGLVVWSVLLGLTRYVSLGSIGAAMAVPIATWFTTRSGLLTGATSVLGALVILRHRTNIGRLLNGTENRIEFGSRKGNAKT